MAGRSLSICRKIGCNELISISGFCQKHEHLKTDSFKELTKKKTPGTIKFYQSSVWTKTSIRHRQNQPLCQECLKIGIVKTGELVHHNPSLEVLLKDGLNPLSDKYLETLCFNCHQKELRAKATTLR